MEGGKSLMKLGREKATGLGTNSLVLESRVLLI
jgi:hypothetical protein